MNFPKKSNPLEEGSTISMETILMSYRVLKSSKRSNLSITTLITPLLLRAEIRKLTNGLIKRVLKCILQKTMSFILSWMAKIFHRRPKNLISSLLHSKITVFLSWQSPNPTNSNLKPNNSKLSKVYRRLISIWNLPRFINSMKKMIIYA